MPKHRRRKSAKTHGARSWRTRARLFAELKLVRVARRIRRKRPGYRAFPSTATPPEPATGGVPADEPDPLAVVGVGGPTGTPPPVPDPDHPGGVLDSVIGRFTPFVFGYTHTKARTTDPAFTPWSQHNGVQTRYIGQGTTNRNIYSIVTCTVSSTSSSSHFRGFGVMDTSPLGTNVTVSNQNGGTVPYTAATKTYPDALTLSFAGGAFSWSAVCTGTTSSPRHVFIMPERVENFGLSMSAWIKARCLLVRLGTASGTYTGSGAPTQLQSGQNYFGFVFQGANTSDVWNTILDATNVPSPRSSASRVKT